jgi:ammonium transporter, Amt family
MGALLVGAVAGAACCLSVSIKYRLGYDDSLDVVGIHMVGGILGTLMVGLIADPDAPNGVSGLFYGGGLDLLWRQAVAVLAVVVYCFVVTWLLAKALDKTMGLRVHADSEAEGLDVAVHGESAYVMEHAPLSAAPVKEGDAVVAAEAMTEAAAEEKATPSAT